MKHEIGIEIQSKIDVARACACCASVRVLRERARVTGTVYVPDLRYHKLNDQA